MASGTKSIDEYTFGGVSLSMIKYACKKKPQEAGAIFGQNLGTGVGVCPFYECKIETKNGQKARIHYCNSNSSACDHLMGIALQLQSGSSSLLAKKVYGRK